MDAVVRLLSSIVTRAVRYLSRVAYVMIPGRTIKVKSAIAPLLSSIISSYSQMADAKVVAILVQIVVATVCLLFRSLFRD